jgi:hypothetical protein
MCLNDIGDPSCISSTIRSSTSLERVYIDKDDLQVGDHVVLHNHPLYEKILLALGAEQPFRHPARF